MSFGGIKHYALIVLDYDKNQYLIYRYRRDRRLTVGQRWAKVEQEACIPDVIHSMPSGANIFIVDELIVKYGLNPKYLDVLRVFAC